MGDHRAAYRYRATAFSLRTARDRAKGPLFRVVLDHLEEFALRLALGLKAAAASSHNRALSPVVVVGAAAPQEFGALLWGAGAEFAFAGFAG